MTGQEPSPRTDPEAPERQIALVDLLDRLLGTGVVLSGDVIITLAGVDLVEVKLHALVTSVRAGRAPAGTEADHEVLTGEGGD